MTHTKSLEEFIFNEVCRISTNELASHKSPTVFEAGTLASKATAAEILRVAEEWCNEPCDTGQITTIDTGDDIVLEPVFSTNGLYLSGNQLYDFLKSYIQPVKKESEDE